MCQPKNTAGLKVAATVYTTPEVRLTDDSRDLRQISAVMNPLGGQSMQTFYMSLSVLSPNGDMVYLSLSVATTARYTSLSVLVNGGEGFTLTTR